MNLLASLQFLPSPPEASLLYASAYDPLLVALSVGIAIFASYAALDVAGRIGASGERGGKLPWLVIGSLAMGGGIWAMHFIGMLALVLPCGVRYDPATTAISLVPGILASAVALELISRRRVGAAHLAVGAVLLGAGIGAMHYAGMAAMRFDGLLRYDPLLFAVSLAVAVALAWLALSVKFGMFVQRWRHGMAAALMGCAIAGMHYTAMAAAYFVRGDGSGNGALNPTLLATAVGVFVGLLISVVLAATMAHRYRETAQRLRVSEQKQRRMLEATQEGFWLIDEHGRTADVNDAFCTLLGRPRGELIGGAALACVGARDAAGFAREMEKCAAGGRSGFELELPRAGGGATRCHVSAAPFDDDAGRRGVIALVSDISARSELDAYRRQAVAVFENTVEGIVITDARGDIVSVNTAFTRMTGYAAEEVLGRNPRLLQSGRHDADFYRALWASIAAGGHWQGEIWNRRKNGEVFPEWLAISAVRDGDGGLRNYIGIFTDISHMKKAEAELQRLAHFDPLTGLANRALLGIQLSHAIDRAERDGEKLAVLMLDLDGFKNVNDSLGHPAGDQLLRIVAERLKGTLRAVDTVARLGGDEFAVVVESLENEESAAAIAEKLIEVVAQPYDLRGQAARVTTSIGIALFPDDGSDAIELMRAADTALYASKREGRNTYRMHDSHMAAAVQARMSVEQGLRNALDKGEFELWYQPQIGLRDGRVTGAEALLRWRHPRLGLVMPAEFIHIAQETGLLLPLGEWVLREACRQARAWLDAGLEFGAVAVNVDGSQIERGRFVDTVERVLADSGLPANRLELEITESFLLANAEQGMGTVAVLRELGATVAIDDFGTGYSSLAYLKYLRADCLKIDRGFVRDLPDDTDDAAITRAVIALARSLGFAVIAEGVETAAQERFLLDEGCDEAQGYLYAKPLPPAEFAAWLKARGSEYHARA